MPLPLCFAISFFPSSIFFLVLSQSLLQHRHYVADQVHGPFSVFRHPALEDQPPHNASYTSMFSCGPCAAWNIHIKRTGAQLEVSMDVWKPRMDIGFNSISLVPFKGGKHWNSTFDKCVLQKGYRVKIEVPLEAIKYDDEYQFFIVMSTWDRIPATPSATLLNKLQEEVTIAKHKEDEKARQPWPHFFTISIRFKHNLFSFRTNPAPAMVSGPTASSFLHTQPL